MKINIDLNRSEREIFIRPGVFVFELTVNNLHQNWWPECAHDKETIYRHMERNVVLDELDRLQAACERGEVEG